MGLSEKDIKDTETLLKAAQAIQTLYNKLYRLDIEGKFFAEEYFNTIDYLSIANSTEIDLCNEICTDASKCNKMAEYLLTTKIKPDFLYDYDQLIRFDYKDNYVLRVKNNLLLYALKDEDRVPEECKNEMRRKIEQLRLSGIIPEEFNTVIITNLDLDMGILTDFMNGFIYILSDEVDRCDNDKIRAKLLESRYQTSYLYQYMNENFMNHVLGKKDYLIDKPIYLINPTIRKTHLYLDQQAEFGTRMVTEQINRLVCLPDRLLEDENNKAKAIIYKSLLRSALYFVDYSIIDMYNRLYSKAADLSNKIYGDDTHKIIDNLICETLSNAKYDKSRLRKIID